MRYFTVLLLLLVSVFTCRADTTDTPLNGLQKDITLFQSLMKTYHPGLYRYHSEASFDTLIQDAIAQASTQHSPKDAFMIMSQLAASIQCGHTMVNPYNQSDRIKADFIDHQKALPLLLKKITSQWFIEIDTSESSQFEKGDELLAINGIPMPTLLEKMLPYVVSDGSNWQKRYARLEMDGFSTMQWFDILLPLITSPKNNQYTVDVKRYRDGQRIQTVLNTQSAKQRKARLIALNPDYGVAKEARWTYRMLDNDVAYLRFHSFATFNMNIDWQRFIEDAFDYFNKQDAKTLILDIRGNGGGMYDVVQLLYRHLADSEMQVPRYAEHTVYTTVADTHRQYLGTWNPAVYDIRQWIQSSNNQVNIIKPYRFDTVSPVEAPFKGDVVVLVDGSNNSATFTMAKELKDTGRATLIGDTNGGNLRGTNGGQMFFVNFPHTGIEVDLPLIGYFPDSPQADQGLAPDIQSKQTFEDWMKDRDTVLQTALAKAAR